MYQKRESTPDGGDSGEMTQDRGGEEGYLTWSLWPGALLS